MRRLLSAIVVFVGHCFAQQPAKVPVSTVPPAGVTVSAESYLFPAEDKLKIRDYQYESDQLEISNQVMLTKIEKNKERQKEIEDSIRLIALNFLTSRKIPVDLYELDLKEAKLNPKIKK